MTHDPSEPAAEARLALLRARYPNAFPSHGDAITLRSIREAAGHEAAVRRVSLDNGDAPAGVFTPTVVADPEGSR